MIVLIFVLNIILNNTLSFAYNDLSIFTSMFLISVIPILKIYIKDNKYYFLIITTIAIIHDFLYSNVFLLTFLIIIIIAVFNHLFYISYKRNLFNIIFTTILSIIFYDSIIFFTLILIYDYSYTIGDLFYKISHSLISNIIIIILLYPFIKSRINAYNKHSNLKF